MLKNRDTPSNPYRVPPQPTPVWIKVCLTLLFTFVFALSGSVIYLTLSPSRCSCGEVQERLERYEQTLREKTGNIPAEKDGESRSLPVPGTGVQSDQGQVENSGGFPDQSFKGLYTRMDQIDRRITGFDSRITNVERKVDRLSSTLTLSRDDEQPTGSFTPNDVDLASLQRVPQRITSLETFTDALSNKIEGYLSQKNQVCTDSSHYRYGVHCYVINEGRMTNRVAQDWCVRDHGKQASLIMLKNRFIQDFISSKLVYQTKTYWVGIKRQRSEPSGLTHHRDLTPAPIQAPLASRSPNQFEYVDGTRVQKNVWQMWRPRTSYSEDDPNYVGESKDCVALYFDSVRAEWRWDERTCSSQMGFICQYFILPSPTS
ncbi:unnamed protein product [Clavelina lepadiformis]|uniref:C-type lectin domain-containing protein n=1 Tax=Clavelina lepadiformis TaxID=159417 RepID=A0ABP0GAW3_CLALP